MNEWRCPRCSKLLGIVDGEHIVLKYKDMAYECIGLVTAICRRCGEESSRESPHGEACECLQCWNESPKGWGEDKR